MGGLSAERLLAAPDSVQAEVLDHLAWLASLSEAALPPDATPAARANVLRWRTAAHVFDGDLAAAAATAREAARLSAPGASGALSDVPLLPALVALYTPGTRLVFDLDRVPDDTDPGAADSVRQTQRALFSALRLRRGDRRGDPPMDDLLPILRAAQRGDGMPLARALHAGTLWMTEADILAVLPRITRGREAVARQLAWAPFSRPIGADWHFPWPQLNSIVLHRDLLRLAGAPAEAARWDAMYRRFDRALEDRRVLIALMLLGS